VTWRCIFPATPYFSSTLEKKSFSLILTDMPASVSQSLSALYAMAKHRRRRTSKFDRVSACSYACSFAHVS
jgi:hypothetical protein